MASRLDSERAPALLSTPAARSSWRRRCSCAQCRTAFRQLQAVHAPPGADAALAWAVDRTARRDPSPAAFPRRSATGSAHARTRPSQQAP